MGQFCTMPDWRLFGVGGARFAYPLSFVRLYYCRLLLICDSCSHWVEKFQVKNMGLCVCIMQWNIFPATLWYAGNNRLLFPFARGARFTLLSFSFSIFFSPPTMSQELLLITASSYGSWWGYFTRTITQRHRMRQRWVASALIMGSRRMEGIEITQLVHRRCRSL